MLYQNSEDFAKYWAEAYIEEAGEHVNPVRKSSTFQRGSSHGALNPVFAKKGTTIIPAASSGLSNGVNKAGKRKERNKYNL
ncbi:MAG TPA: hypothetical protein VGA86_02480, partial [Desulfatiglandales bacterium]